MPGEIDGVKIHQFKWKKGGSFPLIDRLFFLCYDKIMLFLKGKRKPFLVWRRLKLGNSLSGRKGFRLPNRALPLEAFSPINFTGI